MLARAWRRRRVEMRPRADRAADGAGQIAEASAPRGPTILDDPVGRRALDRLLITAADGPRAPRAAPSFAAYITPDGRRARIDLVQADRVFSAAAMDQVETLRRRLERLPRRRRRAARPGRDHRGQRRVGRHPRLTRADQVQSWFIVPIGVFLVLLVALRDPWACLNLVATMVLTYAFALGATHLVFVTLLGAEGLDWKVPYFLFVLLVAVGVDYNVFLMTRLREESAGARAPRGDRPGDRPDRRPDHARPRRSPRAASPRSCSARWARSASSASPWWSGITVDAAAGPPAARPLRPLAAPPPTPPGPPARDRGGNAPGRASRRPGRASAGGMPRRRAFLAPLSLAGHGTIAHDRGDRNGEAVASRGSTGGKPPVPPAVALAVGAVSTRGNRSHPGLSDARRVW